MSLTRFAHIVRVTKNFPSPTTALVNDVIVYSQYAAGNANAPADCEAIVQNQITNNLSVPIELEAKRVISFYVVYIGGG